MKSYLIDYFIRTIFVITVNIPTYWGGIGVNFNAAVPGKWKW